MRIFMSLATTDREKAGFLIRYLRSLGHRVYIATENLDFESPSVVQKIKREIENSDLLFAILTENSLGSPFVQNEIGYADNADDVPILAVLQKGLETKISGFLYGRELLVLDLDNPDPTVLARINPYLRRRQTAVSVQATLAWGFVAFLGYLVLLGPNGLLSNWVKGLLGRKDEPAV